jgi:hypothetical protein
MSVSETHLPVAELTKTSYYMRATEQHNSPTKQEITQVNRAKFNSGPLCVCVCVCVIYFQIQMK